MQMRYGASEHTKFMIIKYLLLNDSAYYILHICNPMNTVRWRNEKVNNCGWIWYGVKLNPYSTSNIWNSPLPFTILKSDKWHLNAAHPHKYSNNTKLNKKHFSRPMKITSLALRLLINENTVRSMLAIIFAYHNNRFSSFSHFAASNCKFFTIAILILS